MQAEVRYLPPHRKDGGTLENIEGERPKAVRTTTPQRIFAQTNPITQPGVYEGDFSFNGGLGGHHATTCRRKWQLGTTNITSSLGSSTSSSGSTKVPQVPQHVQQIPQQHFVQPVAILDLREIREVVQELYVPDLRKIGHPMFYNPYPEMTDMENPTQGGIGSLVSPCSLEKKTNPP